MAGLARILAGLDLPAAQPDDGSGAPAMGGEQGLDEIERIDDVVIDGDDDGIGLGLQRRQQLGRWPDILAAQDVDALWKSLGSRVGQSASTRRLGKRQDDPVGRAALVEQAAQDGNDARQTLGDRRESDDNPLIAQRNLACPATPGVKSHDACEITQQMMRRKPAETSK
jgi:hypothetical protein